VSSEQPPAKKTMREAILDAAVQVFVERSEEVRLEDVAQKAGVSRQAVYIHFGSRTGLLVEMARHLDERFPLSEHVEQLARAPSGLDAIDIAIPAPATYYPLAYPIAKLFLAGRYADEAMRTAWDDRMKARRVICDLLVRRLKEDGVLAPHWDVETATDALWVLTSWQVWEQLVVDQGWSKERYMDYLRTMIHRTLIDSAGKAPGPLIPE